MNLQVNTAEQKVSAVNVGHVENEIELRAANIVGAPDCVCGVVMFVGAGACCRGAVKAGVRDQRVPHSQRFLFH